MIKYCWHFISSFLATAVGQHRGDWNICSWKPWRLNFIDYQPVAFICPLLNKTKLSITTLTVISIHKKKAKNRPFIHPSTLSSVHSCTHRDNRLLCCVYGLCGTFSQAHCAVDSGSLFTLIKFNRLVSVSQDPEHTGQQWSNADFHYLKLRWPNYIQSNQH